MLIHTDNMRGLLHELRGEPIQDAVCVLRGKEAAVAVLCDGAGSYTAADEGARVMAAAMAHFLQKSMDKLIHLPEQVVRCLFAERIDQVMRRQIQLHPERFAADPCAMASTVLCVGYRPASGEYISVQLGDGAIVAQDGSGDLSRVFDPPDFGREFVTALTCMDKPELLQYIQVKKGTAKSLMLLSDGAQGLFYSLDGSVTDYAHAFVSDFQRAAGKAFVEQKHRFLEEYAPGDDFSVCVLAGGAPTELRTADFDYRARGDLHRRRLRDRRIRRQFCRYSDALDSGFPRKTAIRRAGWGKNGAWKAADAEKKLIR